MVHFTWDGQEVETFFQLAGDANSLDAILAHDHLLHDPWREKQPYTLTTKGFHQGAIRNLRPDIGPDMKRPFCKRLAPAQGEAGALPAGLSASIAPVASARLAAAESVAPWASVEAILA